jgi:hypothetical protein
MIYKLILKRVSPRVAIAALFTTLWYIAQMTLITPYREGGLAPGIQITPAPALAFAAVVYAAAAWFNYLRMDRGLTKSFKQFFHLGKNYEDERFKKEMKMKMDAAELGKTAGGSVKASIKASDEINEIEAHNPEGEDETARLDARQKIAANLIAAGLLAVSTFFFVW